MEDAPDNQEMSQIHALKEALEESRRALAEMSAERDRFAYELAESEQRLRMLVEGPLEHAILMIDVTGTITGSNAAAERLFRCDESDLLGRKFEAIFVQSDRAAGYPEQEFAEAAEQGQVTSKRWRQRKDGTRFWADNVVFAMRDPTGHLRGFGALIRDITDEKQATDRLQADYAKQHRIAETLQRAMLQAIPDSGFPELVLETLYEAALDEAELGGDFFDAFALSDHEVAVVVGDVSGKGLAAAARTAEIKYSLRAFLHTDQAPEDAVTQLNAFVYEAQRLNGDDDTFVVLAVCVINRFTGTADFVSAGAEPPTIFRADNSVENIATSGRPLGIAHDSTYEVIRATLNEGDTIILATDGIVEARAGGKFFGHEGIAECALRTGPDASAADLARSIYNCARSFTGGHLRDDACLLLARWTPDALSAYRTLGTSGSKTTLSHHMAESN